jgi:hypothetical protein
MKTNYKNINIGFNGHFARWNHVPSAETFVLLGTDTKPKRHESHETNTKAHKSDTKPHESDTKPHESSTFFFMNFAIFGLFFPVFRAH